MKQKIMEALLSSNNDLSKEEILWASSNLPDDDKIGNYHTGKFVIDHSKETLHQVFNIPADQVDKISKILADATRKHLTEDDFKLSMAVEEVLNKSEDVPFLYPMLIAKTLKDATEKMMESSVPKHLIDLIKILTKKTKDEDDDSKDL